MESAVYDNIYTRNIINDNGNEYYTEVGSTMNPEQLRELITETLQDARLYSKSAVELLMLTAAVESNLGEYIKQINGPALGIFQMEPFTHDDIWENYLYHKTTLGVLVDQFATVQSNDADTLKSNLGYAIIMARVHYLRMPRALPAHDDLRGLAAYWKRYYNTFLGKGTVEKAMAAYQRFCV